MSIFGQSPGHGPHHSNGALQGNSNGGSASPAGVYGRGDLQAAFNWLVNQPEHIRKQASDPDRLMTLYYRSSGRPDMIRTTEITRTTESARTETARIETEAPVSGQTFISDLRQINEALRQFDGPAAQATVHTHPHAVQPDYQGSAPFPGPFSAQPSSAPLTVPPHQGVSPSMVSGKAQAMLSEIREQLNLSSDVEALNVLVSLGYRALKPLLG